MGSLRGVEAQRTRRRHHTGSLEINKYHTAEREIFLYKQHSKQKNGYKTESIGKILSSGTSSRERMDNGQRPGCHLQRIYVQRLQPSFWIYDQSCAEGGHG